MVCCLVCALKATNNIALELHNLSFKVQVFLLLLFVCFVYCSIRLFCVLAIIVCCFGIWFMHPRLQTWIAVMLPESNKLGVLAFVVCKAQHKLWWLQNRISDT